ncbi:YidC/Oxa1 family membrane protein insertase [Streptomyces sp. A7024]|uniref:Membrane protein insertase YidC n=1 Tax=Streptomyces coryli TaxID=1128680 RepID=A0A6G4U663_9ACTN|nr:YidC/Oxa1 family membrane protein insertase [Streptomyces coryli]NGN66787.1 YidC/Oxa1 family membrane protein insertase [Streptomyces coryli]
MSVFSFLGDLLSGIANVIDPVFGDSAAAVAVIVFTLLVRLSLHPLARAAVRGEKARAELAPQLAELQRKHKGNPEKLQRAMTDLYKETGSSPLAGCGPVLLQLPVFMVMYRLFSGHDHDLLDHTLGAAQLGDRWADALGNGGMFGAEGLVYVTLFAVIAAVATWSFLQTRRLAAVAARKREEAQAADQASRKTSGKKAAAKSAAPESPLSPETMAGITKWMPLLAFGTLVTAAVVPLAAGLYLATTTAWTVAERGYLRRERPLPAEAIGSTG